tara:strand:+ start:3636 stop:3962 length:327 start_codon:yes stop_codon:yes gene_type:complete
MLEKLNQLEIGTRIHLIIQSLNGYKINRSILSHDITELLSLIHKSDLQIIEEEYIEYNEWVILITIPEILHSENMTFENIALSGIKHKYVLEENFLKEDIMVNLFSIR